MGFKKQNMTAQEAREKVIEQHTAQKAVSDILECIEKEIEKQEYFFDEDNNKFYIEVEYNYLLDGAIENRTDSVVQELNNLGYEVDKYIPQNMMFIHW